MKQIYQVCPADTNENVLLVASDRQDISFSRIVVANTDGSARTVNIYCRLDGVAGAQTNALLYAYSIAANTTYVFEIDFTLPRGSKAVISVAASAANVVVFTVSSRE